MKEKIIFSTLVLILCWNVSLHYNSVVLGSTILTAIFFIKKPFPICTTTLHIIISFLFVFIFLLLINIFLHDNANQIMINNFIKKISFLFIFFILIVFIFKNHIEELVIAIEIALCIFVTIWFFQLIIFYITGEYLDLLKPFNGVEQRYQAYFLGSATSSIIRPTSLFNEPGTYAMATLPLLILSYLYRKKFIVLYFFTLLSYFLSLSLFAILSAIMFSIIVALSNIEIKLTIKNIIIMIFFIAFFILVFLGLQYYIETRFIEAGNSGAINLRKNILHHWLSLNSISILFGQGFAQTKFPLSVVNDTSLMFKILYEYGIFSIPLLALMVYISRGISFFMLILILLTKMSYLSYIFWFYFTALYLINLNNKNFSNSLRA